MVKKVLFIYGTRVKRDEEGKLYCGLSEDVWQRYKKLGENLTFLGVLVKEVLPQQELRATSNLLDSTNIRFVEYFKQNTVRTFLDIRIKAKNRNIIRREIDAADIVIIRMPTNEDQYALKYALGKRKLIITEVVGCPFDAYWNHSWKGKVLAIPQMLKLKWCTKRSTNVIYVTNEFLQKRYPTNGNSIGCSDVALQEIDENILPKRFEKLDNTDKEVVLGTIGGYTVKYKCQDILIQIVAELRNRGYHVRGQLVGGGDFARLENLAKQLDILDSIDFLGSLKHEEVFGWLDNIDFYMQLSKQEGLPRSVVEAMSRGVPCVGSNVGGIPELIQSDLCFRHDKNMVSNIVNKIIEIMDNKDELKEISVRNLNKAKEYEYYLLEEKRNSFMKKCAESVGGKIE